MGRALLTGAYAPVLFLRSVCIGLSDDGSDDEVGCAKRERGEACAVYHAVYIVDAFHDGVCCVCV